MYRGEMGRKCERCVGEYGNFSIISENSSCIDPSLFEWEKKPLCIISPQKINTIFTGMIWRLKQKENQYFEHTCRRKKNLEIIIKLRESMM